MSDKPDVISLGRGRYFVNGILAKRVRSNRRRSRPANPPPHRRRPEKRMPETDGWRQGSSPSKRWRLRYVWQSKSCSYCHLRRWSSQQLRMEICVKDDDRWIVRSRPVLLEPQVAPYRVYGYTDPPPQRLCKCFKKWPHYFSPPSPIWTGEKQGNEKPSMISGSREAASVAV